MHAASQPEDRSPVTSLIPVDMPPSQIATRCTSANLLNCHDQQQSPLLSIIPPEIRDMIFRLVTLPFEDTEHPIKPTDWCYRPDYRFRYATSTSLLLTCRRIWLESNTLPIAQAVPFTFWFDEGRRPAWLQQSTKLPREESRMTIQLSRLTANNMGELRAVRIFAQMYWLEGLANRASRFYSLSTCRPRVLTVTIRHTDWWSWEGEAPLHLKLGWLRTFLSRNTTKSFPIEPRTEFRLELETLDYKVGQLRTIIDEIRREWTSDGGPFKLQPDSGKQTLAWSGPTDVGTPGRSQRQYANLTKLEYRVYTLVWKRTDPGPSDHCPVEQISEAERYPSIAQRLDSIIRARRRGGDGSRRD